MTDEQLYHLYQTGVTYREIAARYGLSCDSVRGRVGRVRRALQREPVAHLPLALSGDWLIAGDVHLPAINNHLVAQFIAIGRRWLRRPRRCILAGDLVNADAFSLHDSPRPTPPFASDIAAARALFDQLLDTFDQIVVLPGNHDRRLSKRTRGALSFPDLIRIISSDPRVVVTDVGFVTIHTPTGQWRVTHGSQYSVNPLVVAERMAYKYGQHIISHHEHRLAMGYDRYGRYIIVNNGGLFDTLGLEYTWLDDSARPAMTPGFTLLRNGYPHLFGGLCDWSWWLPNARPSRQMARQARI